MARPSPAATTSQIGSLTFCRPPDEPTITLLVYGDRLSEGDESFAVLLDNLVNANVGNQAGQHRRERTPLNIDHALGIDPLTVLEGDVGTSPAVFTVSLAVPYDEEVTVHYYTLTGHASDIVAGRRTLRFAPGQTSQTITVQVVGDLLDEQLEAFDVYLDNPSPNATIVNSAAIASSRTMTATPTMSIGDVSQSEGNSGTTRFTFTLTLSGPIDGGYVQFATASGTATANQDYVAKSGYVLFDPGRTTLRSALMSKETRLARPTRRSS